MTVAQPRSSAEPSAVPGVLARSGQYLTFLLAGEEYGVDILAVQEIRGWNPVTRIPHAPPHVEGVLNLRGAIVPIIDLRSRFGLEQIGRTPTTVVIVLSVVNKHGKRVIGAVVDKVSDVLNVPPEGIKPPPDFGSVVRTEFILGMAALGNRMVILLDSDKLFTDGELETLDAVHRPTEGA